MDILVRGYYGKGNFGDDLLARFIISYLDSNYTGVKIYCDVDLEGYSPKLFHNIISAAEKEDGIFDFLLLGGGTQFFDFGTYSGFRRFIYWYEKYVKNPLVLFDKFKRKQGYFFHKKVALGIGVGPFFSVKSKDAAVNVLGKYDFVSVRDINSIQHLQASTLGDVFYCADVCLSNKVKLFQLKNNKNIVYDFGVVLRDWKERNVNGQFNETIVNSFRDLCLNGKKVLFFVYSEADVEIIALLKKYSLNFVVWNPKELSLQEFAELHQKCAVIVSSRYHGLITALKLNIPIVPLIIEPKIEAFSKELGIEKDSVYLNNVSKEVLSNISLKQLEKKCFPMEKYKELCGRADKVFEQLDKIILG